MPILHENHNIDKINHGGAPDIIWCAKMIMRLKIDYTPNQRNVFLNLIRDLGIDPSNNPNLFAIDFGDGFGVQYLNNLNLDYEFRNNIKDNYNITLYSTDDKIQYLPVDTYKDEIHFKVDKIKFNYNPEVKPYRLNSKKFQRKRSNIDSIQNGVVAYNAEDVYVVYHNQDIVFGSKIDADELIYEIEIIDPDIPIRLINPLSHPRFSWERLKHNIEIVWGDGYITKLYDYYINTGRFNRFSSIIPQHTYENAIQGQKFTIRIKSKEPLTPIGCKVIKIDGIFPIDNYLVKDEKYGNEIVGLFGECNHEDYPEISLLSSHRNTITSLGANICQNYLNTSMKNHFKGFNKLKRIENGFFDALLEHCRDYSSCFENNTLLEYVPKSLLGYVNNTVINIDNMFKNTLSLIESLELRKSMSLTTCNGIYSNSNIHKLYDLFLYECPNLKYGNNICYNATNLSQISINQFKFSNQLEEMSNGFTNTKIEIPFYLSEKRKLWNLQNIFRNIKTLRELKINMFYNMGIDAQKDVNINNIFKDSGDNNGCVVPNEFFSSLKNVKSFTDVIEGIMENFIIKGNDFPSQLFNGVFHVNKPKTYSLINPFKGVMFSETNVEFRNKVFVGDNSNLIGINGFISNLRNIITYIKSDLLSQLPNLLSLNSYFSNCKIHCIFPEEFLINQRQLKSASYMFENVYYKYNHFPIDYLIRTDSETIDLTGFYKNSNIKTYRLIHWSSNKNLIVNPTNLINPNSQTVPLSFILDNRTLNPSIDFLFNKSTIKFLSIALAGGNVTFEAINPYEDIIVDWGDGSQSIFNASNSKITHTYQTKGTYIITYASHYAIIPISRNNFNFMEIKGEFPYSSIPTSYLDRIELGTPGYIDSIFHIANMEYTHRFKCTPNYINPYYFKYSVNMKRCDAFASNKNYNVLTVLPAKFFINCVGLEDFSNILNVSSKMIPDNIFPVQLINSTYQKNKLWIGKYQDSIVFRNKQIISDALYQSYMNDDVCPFGTSWQTKPKGITLKDYPIKANNPLDEYLGFVINKNQKNLGLERLINNSDNIGEIKIEIFASEVQTNKTLIINSDSQLSGCIGDINIDPEIGFAYIRIYSKVPLWLTSHDIISELRGVIPPCILSTPMQSLAPNLEWYGETLLSRLENTSFRGFMANLPKLRFIHRSTFSRNIKAFNFESCFENDIGLLEVPDYLIQVKDYDINCRKMFKGCTSIKYVYRPIDDSVRGRIDVTEMFDGVKTIAFNSSNIDNQVFNKLWYIGSSNLGQHTSNLKRPTVDAPTVCGWTEGYDINEESFTNSVYFEGSEIVSVLTSKSYSTNILKYAQSRMIDLSRGDILPKMSFKVTDYIDKLKYLPCIYKLDFKDESWYANRDNLPYILQTFNAKLFMYNENLLEIKNAFSNSEIATPISSIFLKFNTVLNSLSGFAKRTWIHHKDDMGLSGILGYDSLGYAFLGGEGIRIPLEFTSFLNSDIECLVDITDLFNTSRINLDTDKFSFGFMYPQLLVKAFAWDQTIPVEREGAIRVSEKLIKNIYSHNSTLENAKLLDQYANISSMFDGNIHNLTGTILPNRIASKAVLLQRGLDNLFRNSYINQINYNPAFLYTSEINEPISIDGLFENTNINKLPILPKGVKTMRRSFKNCKHILEDIPKNYINTDEVDGTEAFSGSSVKINNKITTAQTVIADDMLKDCVSTINENDIFTSWSGFSKAITPDHRYAINNPNVFVQTIDIYPQTSLYDIDTMTSITNLDKNKPFKVDFGDGVIKTVTLDDFEHHYKESGIYTIIFYLDNIDFVPFIPSQRTLSISRLPKSDVSQYKTKNFSLYKIFGSYIEMIEDDFFRNVTGVENIKHLSVCQNLIHLKVDPIVITEKMTSLVDLSYYYTLVKCKNINDIPINIKKQILTMDFFGSESNINITENYIKDFINLRSMKFFGFKSSGFITPKLIQHKKYLSDITAILTDSKVKITSEYNDFFLGTNLKDAIRCFDSCSILEFPNNIIKNTQLEDIDCLFANGTEDDNPFEVPEDFLPDSIMSTYMCFSNRLKCIDYHQNIFKNKPYLENIIETFEHTGIRHIKKYTICSESKNLYANGLFRNTQPEIIDDDIAIKWDTRFLDITSILDNVYYNKPFKKIIGRGVKYQCITNNYVYTQPQYQIQVEINKPNSIQLINTMEVNFPMSLDMHILYGDDKSVYIDKLISLDDLLAKTEHFYKKSGDYTIKVMGSTVIQLEVKK